MRSIFLVVACGLSLGWAATPAKTQVVVSDRQAEQASERSMVVSAATQRVTALLLEILGDRAISAAASPNSLAAAVKGKAQIIANARTEMGEISRDLAALKPIFDASSPGDLRAIDQGARNASTLAQKADGILAALQAVPEAVRTGNQAQFDAAYRSVISGTILLHEAQGLILRQQGALLERSKPQSGQFAAMACFSDGQAAMQAGMSGLRDRETAVTEMAAAEACMREQVGRGLSTMDTYADLGPVFARLAPLQAGTFDAITEAADWLGDVREALARGENAAVIASTYNPVYARIVTRIQELGARQNKILAEQD